MLKRLAINSASNLTRLLVGMVITFLMAPFYLEMMGHHDYGLREMVVALIGYMGMIDLGMRPTMSRFSARHNAQDDRQTLNVVYACSLVFMVMVGLLIAVFFWSWAALYPHILVQAEHSDEYKYVLFLLVVGIQVLLAFPRFVTESFLEGLQFYYLKNAIEIAGAISLAIVSYTLMTPQNALVMLTVITVIISAIKLLLFATFLMVPRFGGLYPNVRQFEWPKLKEMLEFGVKSFIQGAARTIEKMSDRLVIGGILGPSSVPVYTIPFTLVDYINNITMTLTHAFMPFFSDLDARGRRAEIRKVYLSASKMVVGLAVPMGVGISIVGAPFIDVWMKGQFDPETVNSIIILLVLYVLTPRLNPFASRFLTAINKHGIFAKVAPIAALTNLGLSVWAVMELGVIGAALGSVLPVFVITPIYLRYACYYLEVSMGRYLTRCVLPILIPTILMASLVLWLRLDWGLTDYPRILLAIVAGGSLYACAFWVLALSQDERSWPVSRLLRRSAHGRLGN